MTDSRPEMISTGSRIGKYEIVQRIAFGGMAEIYLARVSGIQGFEKYIVLKRILPQYAVKDDFVQMFLREARLAATLDQANIAHVHDIGEVGGSYFYTMEYLHGEDVRTIMRELARKDARLPLEHAIGIILGAASGLHYAHEKTGADGRPLGIVHRDVSPSNIVVTFDGGVKVVDFGIAKMTADPDLSRGYAPKGKLAYMSPEQVHAEPVDRRSDVFSLGVVLYEITTHKRLFAATTEIDTMRLVLKGAVPAPSVHDPGYPPDLEAIVMRSLETKPDRRYPSARELQRDLELFSRRYSAQVSSVALAEWMERTFGPKREPWRLLPPGGTAAPRFPTPTPSPTPSATAPLDATAATRLVSRPDVIVAPAAAAGENTVAVEVSWEEPAVATTPTTTTPARRAGRRVWMAGAGLLVAASILAMVAVGAIGRSRARSAAEAAADRAPQPAAPVVMVVAEGGNVAVERAPAVETPPAVAQPALARSAAAPSSGRAPAATARVPARARTAGGASSFSASLARHEPEIRSCFAHSPQAAATAGETSFRFQVRTDGHVASVTVLPDTLAATPLGACLAQVGARTVFAPQPEPVTFRIPLSLRVNAVDKTRR